VVNEIEGLLPQALGHLANGAVHRPDLAAAARRGVRQHRRLIAGPITVGIAVLLVLGFGWVARGPGMGSGGPGPPAGAPRVSNRDGVGQPGTIGVPTFADHAGPGLGPRWIYRNDLSAVRLLGRRQPGSHRVRRSIDRAAGK